MSKKTVSSIMMALLVLSTMALAVKIQIVKADATIDIRADGSITPSTAPIQTDDNLTYTLTGDIYTAGGMTALIIERSNITLDGASHTISAIGLPGFTQAVMVNNVSGVTIKNVTVLAVKGILLQFSSYCNICETVADCAFAGIILYSCLFNNIQRNVFTNGGMGLVLSDSNDTFVSEDSFMNSSLLVENSFQSTVVNNTVNGKPLAYFEGASKGTVKDVGEAVLVNCENMTIEDTSFYGQFEQCEIELWGTNSSLITGNNMTVESGTRIFVGLTSYISGYCIMAWYSSNDVISGNNLTDTGGGLLLKYCTNCSISENNVTNNYDGLVIDSSLNNTICENDISHNDDSGIWVTAQSDYNNISLNNMLDNGVDIELTFQSDYNCIFSNNMLDCKGSSIDLSASDHNNITQNNIAYGMHGIYLSNSNYNVIFHNGFVNNTHGTLTSNSTNIWDDGYPFGGNYWSDYNGTDSHRGPYQNETGSDGIGDTPYVIDANNTDNYPLMTPYTQLVGDLNNDGKVGLEDLILLANAYNSKPGDSNWNPMADITPPYGIVGLTDLVTLGMHYGQHYP